MPRPTTRHDREQTLLLRSLLARVDPSPRWLPPMLPPAFDSLIDGGSLSEHRGHAEPTPWMVRREPV